MKSKILIPILTALIASACSSTYFASTGHDDLYYRPGIDAPKYRPVAQTAPVVKKSNQDLTDYERYREVLEKEELYDSMATANTGAAEYYAKQNPARQDDITPKAAASTSIAQENDMDYDNTYAINSDYTSRINRFHDGFWGYGTYDPFWDDPYYYTPGWSFGFSFGNSWGYSPYYYGYGYYGYGYPYCGYNYPYSYYGYAGGYYGGYYSSPGVIYGTASSARSNGKYIGINGRSTSSSVYNRIYSATRTKSASSYDNATSSILNPASAEYGRARYTRAYTEDDYRTGISRTKSETTDNASVSASSSRTYTPSYSKPRTYSRPTYNEAQPSSYSRSYSNTTGSTSSTNAQPTQSYSRTYSSTPTATYNTSSSSNYSGSNSRGSSSSTSSGSSSSGSSRSSGSTSSGGRR
jgi:hypothetical protein